MVLLHAALRAILSRSAVSAWHSFTPVAKRQRPRFAHLRTTPLCRASTQQREVQVGDASSSSNNNNTNISTPSEGVYKELQWLSQEIRKHDELYYNAQPILEDSDYDALVRRERELELAYPDLLQQWQQESGLGMAATRSGRVGTNSTGASEPLPGQIRKRPHLSPMLSLDNVHSLPEFQSWLEKRIVSKNRPDDDEEETKTVTILTEPKLDGVSLSLRYKEHNDKNKYQLEWASTRGDGKVGQDVTAAVHQMGSIQLELKNGLDLGNVFEIRGEVVLPQSTFSSDVLATITNSTFSNARNAASGILLRKEDLNNDQESKQLRQLLRFFAYDLVVPDRVLNGMLLRESLEELGFSLPAPVAVSVVRCLLTLNSMKDDIGPLQSYYHALDEYRSTGKTDSSYDFGDFDMDGCVHKIVSVDWKETLGRSTKSPKWAIAHKFPPMAVISTLQNVAMQVGRTGAITPVAILDPVEVGGVTIQRATLHNFGHLQTILGADSVPVGTKVLVRRAGDVIPQVVQLAQDVASTSSTGATTTTTTNIISLQPPNACPACGSEVVYESISTNKTAGQVIRCNGPPLLCPPRAVTSLAHAFSRDALDVTGLSEARIEQLMQAKLIRVPSDVFDLDWDKVADLPGWGTKSSQNLQRTLQRVAREGVTLGRFIFALGIRHVGKHSSDLVAASYGSADAFLQAVESADKWEDPVDDENGVAHPFSALTTVDGVGPVLLRSLVSFSKTEGLVEAARSLANAIPVLEEAVMVSSANERTETNKPWDGFRVVFTGGIANLTRSEAQMAAKQLGAKSTPNSVSKSTNVVVFGEKGGKKLQQAQELGVQTMDVDEFLTLLEKQGVK